MKLAMMRRIAHHTSGDSRPLIPVQDKALAGSATSVAPRFKRSSDTNTHSTLNPSSSHGLPKPVGRFWIFLFVLSFVMSSEVACQAAALCEGLETFLIPGSRSNEVKQVLRFLDSARNDNDETAALSKLIGVGKALQNRVVPGRPEI